MNSPDQLTVFEKILSLIAYLPLALLFYYYFSKKNLMKKRSFWNTKIYFLFWWLFLMITCIFIYAFLPNDWIILRQSSISLVILTFPLLIAVLGFLLIWTGIFSMKIGGLNRTYTTFQHKTPGFLQGPAEILTGLLILGFEGSIFRDYFCKENNVIGCFISTPFAKIFDFVIFLMDKVKF